MHLKRNKISPKPKLSIKANTGNRKRSVHKKIFKKKIDVEILKERREKNIAKIKSRIPPRTNLRLKKRSHIKYEKISREYQDFKFLKEWKDLLKGHPAFLLGNGPSITQRNLSLLDNYFTIGINRIFLIYEPTILFWQDRELWRSNESDIINCKSIKVCRNIGDPRRLFVHFYLGMDPFRFSGKPHKMYGRGNTGVLTAQFAVSLGCSSVILLGMDCKVGPDGRSDFYGNNPHHKPYTLKMCRNAMKWLKNNCPIPVYNCSENTILPQHTIEDVIKELDPEPIGRKYIRRLFLK